MSEILGAHIPFLIKEARMREDFGRLFDQTPQPELPRLLDGLIRQSPNRAYVGTDGSLARVLLYADTEMRYPFSAFIQILTPFDNPQEWEITRQTTVIGRDRASLESEISFWRGVYGLRGDLLANPDSVQEVKSPFSEDPEYVHTIGKTSCRYSLSPVGPRFYYFTRNSVEGATETRQLGSVPEDLMRYTQTLNPGS